MFHFKAIKPISRIPGHWQECPARFDLKLVETLLGLPNNSWLLLDHESRLLEKERAAVRAMGKHNWRITDNDLEQLVQISADADSRREPSERVPITRYHADMLVLEALSLTNRRVPAELVAYHNPLID